MSNGVRIDSSVMEEFNVPQTVEDSIKYYSAWSGISSFRFDSAHNSSLPILNSDASGVQYFGLPDVSGSFVLECDVDVPDDFASSTSYESDDGDWIGFSISSSGYEFTIRAYPNQKVQVHGSDNRVYHRVPSEELNSGRWLLTVHQGQYSDQPEDSWLTFSLWANGCRVFSYSHHHGFVLPEYGVRILQTTLDPIFQSVRIPQLHEFVEWSSVDPGENASGGLNRTLEGRYVKTFIRHDGSFSAFKSVPRNPVAAFLSSDLYSMDTTHDPRSVSSHIRMMGAYEWAEHINFDLIDKIGHRFSEVNNPYLMSPEACLIEAANESLRQSEALKTVKITMPYNPLLEPEDVISIDGVKYIIDSISVQFGGTITASSLSLRSYTRD